MLEPYVVMDVAVVAVAVIDVVVVSSSSFFHPKGQKLFPKVVVRWRCVAGVLVVAQKHFPTIRLFPASLGS